MTGVAVGEPGELPPMDHAGRRGRVAARLGELGCDALLVSRPVNVGYLTSFTGSAGALLLRATGDARLATDGRYATQVADEAPDLPATITRSDDWLVEAVPAGARLGLESHAVSWDRAEALRERLDGVELVRAGRVVEAERERKDDAELARVRAACQVTDAAFAELCEWVGAGVTERQVASFLIERMALAGADAAAFEPIVAAGEHGARPHHRPTERPLQAGDLVTVDVGARVDGYHADMTRLIALGEIDERLAQAAQAVRAAQEAGVATVGDGVAAADVDRRCRQALADAGLQEAFTHGTGHGVGLELHEAPRVAPGCEARLAARMVCTVEPGAYLPGLGGARIEDTVAVTTDGAARLTQSPRDVVVR